MYNILSSIIIEKKHIYFLSQNYSSLNQCFCLLLIIFFNYMQVKKKLRGHDQIIFNAGTITKKYIISVMDDFRLRIFMFSLNENVFHLSYKS